jgi:DNA invertase Pin-like site-specific DNA recombinase
MREIPAAKSALSDKAKGERGVPLTTNVPYGYLKDPDNPRRWKIDPVAADVVRRIFSMCMEGRGPKQIANQLKADKVLTPTAYKTLQGIKSPNKKPEDPYGWGDSTPLSGFWNGGNTRAAR